MKKVQPWIGLLARLVLGGVLLVAGYLKAFTPDKSMMAVRAYEILPIWLANVLGIILPWLEIGAGLLLILGVAIRYASIFGAGLMMLFIIAIAQAWARGLSIDCGCFGGGGTIDPSQTRYLEEILRDAALALCGLYLLRYPLTKFALEKTKSHDLTPSQGE
jgi:uncharacterized membrane protein YphA (DoxX/SURF4 family)